jgi:hypothetical protein
VLASCDVAGFIAAVKPTVQGVRRRKFLIPVLSVVQKISTIFNTFLF